MVSCSCGYISAAGPCAWYFGYFIVDLFEPRQIHPYYTVGAAYIEKCGEEARVSEA